jgi:hypothetical protein
MPPTVHLAQGLYAWKLQYEDGSERVVLGSSLNTLISGATPIVSAIRGSAAAEEQAPVVDSLVPASAQLGDPDFTLHVHGSNFNPGAVIVWNGGEEPTTYVSETELTTDVNMATATVAGAYPVFVRAISRQESNSLDFTLNPAP